MLTGLLGDVNTFHGTESIIELVAIGFVTNFNGTTARRKSTMFGWDPLHILRDRQQILPPAMLDFTATV